MERKRLIAIVVVVIVIAGILGWYFTFGTQSAPAAAVADVKIDDNEFHYTIPINWTLTAVPGATNHTDHTITNLGNNVTNVAFNYTVSHLEGGQWVEQFNGTNWLVNNPAVAPSIIVQQNTSAFTRSAYADKPLSGESAIYTYNLVFNDKMIYLNLNYPGHNPTADGQTVFAYVAFDVNGNGTLNPADKAFNFTSNSALTTKNQLLVYTPEANLSSWNPTPHNYPWNGSVSSTDVPITVLYSGNGTSITFAIPFTYIGAIKGGHVGFVLQAFSHNWVTNNGSNDTALSNYVPVSLSLPPATSITLEPNATLTFYTKAVFASAASGEYMIVYQFQASVQTS
jgi:hypothetical protein